MRVQRGFSLIEMLVAMAIFSSLIGVLLMGFHQGLSLWDKGQQKTVEWISLEQRYDWLERLFLQVNASDYSFVGKGDHAFFLGEPLRMELVSSAPIMSTLGPGMPIQFRLMKKNGQYDLMYREGQQGDDVSMKFSFDSNPWVLIFQNLREASFRYEAPANPYPFETSLESLSPVMRKQYRNSPEWRSSFKAELIGSLPSRVAFSFVDKNGDAHHWRFHCRYMSDVWSKEFYSGVY